MNNPIAYTAAMMTAIAIGPAHGAVPEVSGVSMAQDDNRTVTIAYTLSSAPAVVTLDVQTNVTGDVWASIGGEAVWNAMGDVWKRVETGSRTITWRPDHTWPGHMIADGGARAVVTAWALDNTPDYMVVDLAATNTVRYYPGVEFLPDSKIRWDGTQSGAVTNNPVYKTSKLLMRKIMAQGVEWTMGSADGETLRVAAAEEPHAVTLTNNYYIGVFEVTQAQWKNIATNSSLAANFTVDGAMRPMEKTSYNEIRNAADSATADPSYDWPADPNPSSFLGLLRSKTGLDFDLPSEAQWEFAARAGNGSGFWNDGSEVQNLYRDTNLDALGRNLHNNPTGESSTSAERMDPSLAPENGGTAIVGSYTPSDWGLYDMHGNVWEWCLDYYQNDITDYGGKVNVHATLHGYTISGVPASDRTLRGGCYRVTADQCRSAYRTGFGPQNRTDHTGFRVVCTAGLR